LAAEVSRNGKSLGTLFPERRLYKASQQPTSEVSIRRRLNEDFYINFAGASADGRRAVIQAYVFPLVSWIWIGFWVLAFGTGVCLIPNKVRLSYARTQVVGVAEKHATVEN
jgi:cytochrome c-type biogenesis protein CcmF